MDSLKTNKLTRFILKLENIWYYDNTYGFNWYIIQAEIKLPINLDLYFFKDKNAPFQSCINEIENNIPIPNLPPPPPPLLNINNSNNGNNKLPEVKK